MKRSLILFLSIISLNASADVWTGNTGIRWVYPNNGGVSLGTKDYANEALSSCDQGRRFTILSTHPNYDAMVSALMMAFAAGKEISMNIDEDAGKVCAPEINRFFVYE